MQTSPPDGPLMSQPPPPAPARIARGFLLGLGCMWIFVGLLIAFSAHPAMHLPWPWNLLMVVLMLLTGLVALGLALALGRRSRFAFFGALAFLAVSALTVILDQVGWVDLMFVAANIIPVILLIKARLWYLGT